MMGVYKIPDNWQEIAWQKLPLTLKKQAVTRLQAYYDPSFFEEVRQLAAEKGLGEWLPLVWHFGQGMQVRNVLRSDHSWPKRRSFAFMGRTVWSHRSISIPTSPIPDSELPALPEIYGDDQCDGNWDDYYVQCIEAAAGLREIES